MLAQEQAAAEQSTINWNNNRGALYSGGTLDSSHTIYLPPDRHNYYYGDTYTKKKIILHYTIGYLGGDLSQLTRDNIHVSVPYVIARSGRIFEIHDPSFWSYHLGPRAVGGNKKGSSESIGIELTNIGPLDMAGNWMWNIYGGKYCHIDEYEYYHALDNPYRGYSYYATFTDEQYSSLASLLELLSTTYDIPLSYLPEPERYEIFPSSAVAKEYIGVCSHVNFRGFLEKSDIGPAFNWDKIIP